jgi:deazaflavin-dependent oxidoreductase (nitroreductase family)
MTGKPAAEAAAPRRRPGALARLLFRSPLLLYSMHLGFLMGRRFLVLTHGGRKTGKVRRTPMEVVSYDKDADETFAISAYGPRSDWYLNITHSPPVLVETGGKRFVPEFRVVSKDEERRRLAAYYSSHPTDAKVLAKRFLHVDESEEGFLGIADSLPMVAFRPRETPS